MNAYKMKQLIETSRIALAWLNHFAERKDPTCQSEVHIKRVRAVRDRLEELLEDESEDVEIKRLLPNK